MKTDNTINRPKHHITRNSQWRRNVLFGRRTVKWRWPPSWRMMVLWVTSSAMACWRSYRT